MTMTVYDLKGQFYLETATVPLFHDIDAMYYRQIVLPRDENCFVTYISFISHEIHDVLETLWKDFWLLCEFLHCYMLITHYHMPYR